LLLQRRRLQRRQRRPFFAHLWICHRRQARSIGILRLEKKLDLIAERIQAGVDSRLDALSAQLAATAQRILATVEGRCSASTPLQPAGLAADGCDSDDRKRLKERLKGAIEQDRATAVGGVGGTKTAGWAEYLFGICKPDGRTGKIGSRYQ
jgi:hypothetical protein